MFDKLISKLFRSIIRKEILKKIFPKKYDDPQAMKDETCEIIQSYKRYPGEIRRVLCLAVQNIPVAPELDLFQEIIGALK